MFSNVYINVGVDIWWIDWLVVILEDIQVVGNDVKKYIVFDFVGIEIIGGNFIDVFFMIYFWVDIWILNMIIFWIKLVDFGVDVVFGGGDDMEYELVFDNLVQG